MRAIKQMPSRRRADETDEILLPDLERRRQRFTRPSIWFWLLSALFEVPGILLVVLGSGWEYVLGWILVALGALPLVVAIALTGTNVVGWWAARGKPFA